MWAWDGTKACYFHSKILDGSLAVNGYKARGHYAPGISPADVLSDEQLEIADLLQIMGMEPQDVSRALAKGRA